jgi:NAD(P)-dependent dehydrogenase (short-subunit alcohol dehydrogenase family)
MQKVILITGATAGIGMETAKQLVTDGHQVLVHGRNENALQALEESLATIQGNGNATGYLADLSKLDEVKSLAEKITDNHQKIDVLINNAGIFKTPHTTTGDGLDVRFVVNTLAPYLLTQLLLPTMDASARVVNLSSAAQDTVNLQALHGNVQLDDMPAYAQSKLAITMWTRSMAKSLAGSGPSFYAINPGSLLATKMVKDAFGMDGKDIGIGVDILMRASLSEEFDNASGQYFDNDIGAFSNPHPDALDDNKVATIVSAIEKLLAKHS